MKFLKSYENICCDDVIQCTFDLNILDFKVFTNLHEIGEAKVDELAQQMKKERSVIYRSLQKLKHCDMCNKKTKTLSHGGYYHVYSCNDTKTIKRSLELCIDNWYKHMKNTLEQFDKH